jgi:hypothetical protein
LFRRKLARNIPISNADANVWQVSIRAYLPIWTFLYILQFLFLPIIAPDFSAVSNFFGNTMYLVALSYYFIITFLGYNGKPALLSRLPLHFDRCADSF